MDLLLISVDSLRLDHAGRAAHTPVRTPRFDRVTQAFGFSERCFSVSSATRPVHTSIVTGLYPFEHGVQGQTDSRVRHGTPRLFAQAAAGARAVGLFSEAPTIFTGLDLGAPVQALPPQATAGVDTVRGWLQSTAGRPRCLLLHYWSAHTPYGAADGQALGETARLLRDGHGDIVRARYRGAVEEVFEAKVAPLLELLDLGQWSVILFGDHGESWTPDELYHGETVRNAVLRVPLYLHVPYRSPAAGWDAEPVSLLDLYPTACGLLQVERQDRGCGRDWLDATPGVPSARFLWAGIRPSGQADDLALGSEPAPATAGRRWCVLDGRQKLMGIDAVASGSGGASAAPTLVDTWTEAPLEDAGGLEAALEARRALEEGSAWCAAPLSRAGDDDDDALLRRRLRDLGYLG